MRHDAPFYSRATRHNCSIDGSMIAFRQILCRGVSSGRNPGHVGDAGGSRPPRLDRADAKLRYQDCLSLANLNPTAALGVAAEWSKAKGGAPADHCTGDGAGRTEALSRSRDAAGCAGPRGRTWAICAPRYSTRPATPGCWRAMRPGRRRAFPPPWRYRPTMPIFMPILPAPRRCRKPGARQSPISMRRWRCSPGVPIS